MEADDADKSAARLRVEREKLREQIMQARKDAEKSALLLKDEIDALWKGLKELEEEKLGIDETRDTVIEEMESVKAGMERLGEEMKETETYIEEKEKKLEEFVEGQLGVFRQKEEGKLKEWDAKARSLGERFEKGMERSQRDTESLEARVAGLDRQLREAAQRAERRFAAMDREMREMKKTYSKELDRLLKESEEEKE